MPFTSLIFDTAAKSVRPIESAKLGQKVRIAAYALSIHKAQGLEYDSVKIIIADECDNLITHDIFYTAITRARNSLKIFWSPEVCNKILSNFKTHNIGKDICLLKQYLPKDNVQ